MGLSYLRITANLFYFSLKNLAWQELADEFNSNNRDVFRWVTTFKNRYENIKRKSRNRLTSSAGHYREIGGGPRGDELSTIDLSR